MNQSDKQICISKFGNDVKYEKGIAILDNMKHLRVVRELGYVSNFRDNLNSITVSCYSPKIFNLSGSSKGGGAEIIYSPTDEIYKNIEYSYDEELKKVKILIDAGVFDLNDEENKKYIPSYTLSNLKEFEDMGIKYQNRRHWLGQYIDTNSYYYIPQINEEENNDFVYEPFAAGVYSAENDAENDAEELNNVPNRSFVIDKKTNGCYYKIIDNYYILVSYRKVMRKEVFYARNVTQNNPKRFYIKVISPKNIPISYKLRAYKNIICDNALLFNDFKNNFYISKFLSDEQKQSIKTICIDTGKEQKLSIADKAMDELENLKTIAVNIHYGAFNNDDVAMEAFIERARVWISKGYNVLFYENYTDIKIGIYNDKVELFIGKRINNNTNTAHKFTKFKPEQSESLSKFIQIFRDSKFRIIDIQLDDNAQVCSILRNTLQKGVADNMEKFAISNRSAAQYTSENNTLYANSGYPSWYAMRTILGLLSDDNVTFNTGPITLYDYFMLQKRYKMKGYDFYKLQFLSDDLDKILSPSGGYDESKILPKADFSGNKKIVYDKSGNPIDVISLHNDYSSDELVLRPSGFYCPDLVKNTKKVTIKNRFNREENGVITTFFDVLAQGAKEISFAVCGYSVNYKDNRTTLSYFKQGTPKSLLFIADEIQNVGNNYSAYSYKDNVIYAKFLGSSDIGLQSIDTVFRLKTVKKVVISYKENKVQNIRGILEKAFAYSSKIEIDFDLFCKYASESNKIFNLRMKINGDENYKIDDINYYLEKTNIRKPNIFFDITLDKDSFSIKYKTGMEEFDNLSEISNFKTEITNLYKEMYRMKKLFDFSNINFSIGEKFHTSAVKEKYSHDDDNNCDDKVITDYIFKEDYAPKLFEVNSDYTLYINEELDPVGTIYYCAGGKSSTNKEIEVPEHTTNNKIEYSFTKENKDIIISYKVLDENKNDITDTYYVLQLINKFTHKDLQGELE